MSSENPDRLRLQILDAVLRLPSERLLELQEFLGLNPVRPQHVVEVVVARATQAVVQFDWPHAPPHRLSEHGTYIITGSTCHKRHHFRGAERLDMLQAELLTRAKAMGWQLEAWAVFSNHYHFVAHAQAGADPLRELLKRLHGATTNEVNELDGTAGRQVWFNFWDTQLTDEASYLARLNYVHQNPVKHGLVRVATEYLWCSAGWFERTASRAQVQTVRRFKTDKVNVIDDFEPVV